MISYLLIAMGLWVCTASLQSKNASFVQHTCTCMSTNVYMNYGYISRVRKINRTKRNYTIHGAITLDYISEIFNR